MADGHNMDDFAQESAFSSDMKPVLLANETLNIEQEVSMPIPGFPPLFQFAKLQTEASSGLQTRQQVPRLVDKITQLQTQHRQWLKQS